ncbi:M67 family metallopeptidase [Halostella sp. JP-L12]|uniref:desampylase n=1 Tax=Halostella TaxID=1843185 RepID=UPI000EF8235B|nr:MULTISPECIES: desampylase [Halostella]NHN48184.1 M67 family metallopeptidase [Halostella sp. JP-L12]
MTDDWAASGDATDDLVFSGGAYDRVLDHARDGAPLEICGVLGGTTGGSGGESDAGERRVETALPVENVADRPRTRYELDPAEQLERIEAIEDGGGEVVGFYHSHPTGPAGPSATDRAQATWPGASYVIVDLRDERVGAWRWTGEAFREEAVRVERD